MDYGEAIEVLQRANEKFAFPVKWGIDLQSEHERYLTQKYAKKPVNCDELPEGHQGLLHASQRRRPDRSRRWTCSHQGSARSSAAVSALGISIRARECLRRATDHSLATDIQARCGG